MLSFHQSETIILFKTAGCHRPRKLLMYNQSRAEIIITITLLVIGDQNDQMEGLHCNSGCF